MSKNIPKNRIFSIIAKGSTFLWLLCIVLCLTLCSCAVAVSAPVLDAPTEPERTPMPTIPAVTEPPTAAPTPTQPAEYHASGYFESDTGTTLVLRLAWEATGDADAITLDTHLYLEFAHTTDIVETTANTLTVGDEKITFAVEALTDYPAEHSPLLLYHFTSNFARTPGQDLTIPLSAEYDYNSVYDGYVFPTLTVKGTVCISDAYDTLPERVSLSVKPIRQLPELPNGCEVTSLAMALAYAGHPISKTELKNKYLPIGDSNFYEHNVGDPASRQSYGCYSPVIVKTADAYFADKGIAMTARNLTHYNIEEIYRALAQGSPVIVWITQNIDTRPYIIRTFEGQTQDRYWKAPLHCMVLTGYDFARNTVTVADPIYGTVTHPRELFETRWHQMGEQAVVLVDKEAFNEE